MSNNKKAVNNDKKTVIQKNKNDAVNDDKQTNNQATNQTNRPAN